MLQSIPPRFKLATFRPDRNQYAGSLIERTRYEAVAEDLRSGEVQASVWVMALERAKGSTERASGYYITLRVRELRRTATKLRRPYRVRAFGRGIRQLAAGMACAALGVYAALSTTAYDGPVWSALSGRLPGPGFMVLHLGGSALFFCALALWRSLSGARWIFYAVIDHPHCCAQLTASDDSGSVRDSDNPKAALDSGAICEEETGRRSRNASTRGPRVP